MLTLSLSYARSIFSFHLIPERFKCRLMVLLMRYFTCSTGESFISMCFNPFMMAMMEVKKLLLAIFDSKWAPLHICDAHTHLQLKYSFITQYNTSWRVWSTYYCFIHSVFLLQDIVVQLRQVRTSSNIIIHLCLSTTFSTH